MIKKTLLIRCLLFSIIPLVSCQQTDIKAPGFDDLPVELFQHIIQYLSLKDIHTLGMVNKKNRAYVKASISELIFNNYPVSTSINVLDLYQRNAIKKVVISDIVFDLRSHPENYNQELTVLFNKLSTLQNLKNLIVFNMFCFHPSDSLFDRLPSSLESLYVGYGSLHSNQLIALCNAIAGYSTLKVLVLINNVMSKVPSDVFLRLPYSLRSLDLSYNHFTTEQLSSLLTKSASMTHLKLLSIAGNNASDVPAKIFSTIPVSLKTLDVERCNLSRQQIRDLLKRISFTNLEVLHLGWNKSDTLQADDWKPLNSAPSLREIDLRGNDISERPSSINECIRVLPFLYTA